MKNILLIIALFMFTMFNAFGQCNFTISNLSDSLFVCKNSSIQLSPTITSTGGVPTYIDTFWTPSTGLSNANILNPLVTVGTSSTNYILTVQGVTPTNLITNGDFSLGDTIFTSDYIYGTGGTYGLLSSAGQYAISTNPALTHINFASFGDHTTGTGNMLVVNGASLANVNIWCQTIAVLPNTDYDFSAWGATCVASNPAILQFSINGVLIGSPLALPITTGVWTPFHATWFSGSNTSITICITDQSTASSGNDFAIDDIAFKQICVVQDSVYVSAINLTPSVQVTYQLGCNEDTVQFIANNGTGTSPSTYTWSFGDGNFSTTPNPTHIYATQGSYIVKLVTESNGCKDSALTVIDTKHPMNALFTIPDTACINTQVNAVNNSTATGSFTSSFDWGVGSVTSDNFYTYTSTGNYTVILTITDQLGCTSSISKDIDILSLPYITLPKDTAICPGDAITLNAMSGSEIVSWSDGSVGYTYQVYQPGIFVASVSNFCGTISDTTNVSEKDCSCYVSIPNAFSPNGDHINDTFKPLFSNCDISNYDISIYDRWGNMMFNSSDQNLHWDGRYKGVFQETGTYFYLLQYYSPYTGIKYVKGDVMIVR